MKFASRLINFDACPEDPFRPLATPIYQTATFEQEEADRFGRYDYSRSGNPTRSVLEDLLADLENATRAFCFASGMAATSTIMRLLRSGDEILAGDDLYGGSCRLFSKVLDRTGIRARYTDACDLDRFEAQFTAKTRLVFVETPTNPLARVVDISALARLAHEHGALLCVDNSAMSPYLQNPLDLGADIVVHSATKYLCGHSDVTAGVAAVQQPALAEEIGFIQNAEGSALAPFDSYLLLRGLKTLKLRLDCQQANALKIAEFLSSHPAVKAAYFPGLPNHPGRDLHFQQARGAGALISFETGSFAVSKQVVEATRMFRTSVSFGSVHSAISVPGCMSHASTPEEARRAGRLAPDLIRLSIGIEEAEDLISDLDCALTQATSEETKAPPPRQEAAATRGKIG
jgi:cystathionine beta-lyase